MCLFLLDRCSLFVSEGIHSSCSSFQCPRTLGNTKLHEYFQWHERVPPFCIRHWLSSQELSSFLFGRRSMMEASESSHIEWWQRQLARPREFSVRKQKKEVNEGQRTSKTWSRQSLDSDTMTSDLQNQTHNFLVLLFPCLKLDAVIQSSDTNWGWSF